MTNATLSLGSESVTIPLLEEGGQVLVSSDLGKPSVNLPNAGGSLFPRSLDNWSGVQNISLRGRFHDSNAYSDAITLVELIEDDWGNDELRLDIGLSEYDSNMLVMASAGSDQAVSLDYQPGHKNDVVVDLSVTRVGRIDGTGSRDVTTPTASGTGPIQLQALGNTVDLKTDIVVNRTAGRPNDVVRRQPNGEFPYGINKQKVITEDITLEFALPETPVSALESIGAIFRSQLGREPVTLDFNGIYGYGAFSVLPVGSAPFRQARRAGYEGMVTCPTFSFRRVYSG